MTDPLVGACLGGSFRIEEPIGGGGMGRVYRATQTRLGRSVAVKVVAPRSDRLAEKASERFRREALAVSRLKHPNTVTVHDFGETDDGLMYLVMELLDGHTLKRRLTQGGPAEPRWLSRILEQVAGSLAEAHAAGILHRDMKPANVFLADVAGRSDVVKVLDFGLAKAFAEGTGLEDVTGDEVVVGSAGYLSPEQLTGGNVDHRTDVWAVGVLAYQALCGRMPFEGDKHAVAQATVHAAPPPPRSLRPDLPREVEQVLLWTLNKHPHDRPSSVTELARTYAAAVGEEFTLEEAFVSTVPESPVLVLDTKPSRLGLGTTAPPPFAAMLRRAPAWTRRPAPTAAVVAIVTLSAAMAALIAWLVAR